MVKITIIGCTDQIGFTMVHVAISRGYQVVLLIGRENQCLIENMFNNNPLITILQTCNNEHEQILEAIRTSDSLVSIGASLFSQQHAALCCTYPLIRDACRHASYDKVAILSSPPTTTNIHQDSFSVFWYLKSSFLSWFFPYLYNDTCQAQELYIKQNDNSLEWIVNPVSF